jgi:amino acid transporter
MSKESVTLKHTIGLGLLTLYGVGTMTGAGIYVLVGKVAGYAGWHLAGGHWEVRWNEVTS